MGEAPPSGRVAIETNLSASFAKTDESLPRNLTRLIFYMNTSRSRPGARLPSRRHVLRTLAGIGVGSQFDVRQGPKQAQLLARAAPSALTLEEELSGDLQTLARRHTPALALANQHMWPVNVSYTWHDGSDLYAEDASGGREVVVPHAALGRYHAPRPSAAPRAGDERYYIDAPGGDGGVSWCDRWRQIQGEGSPREAAYPPTQYVHPFWLNRGLGLLALQYWFYYPFNDWVNKHEGDWEHIVVVLEGATTLSDADLFQPRGQLFYFHDWIHEPERTVALRGDDERAHHVVVFVGGKGDLWNVWRCGRKQSGGSYPWPGRYGRAGSAHEWLAPSEDLREPSRFLAPEEFELVLLPEPDRVSASYRPELWWMAWPVYFGQRRISGNFPLLSRLGLDHPPTHPGRHRDWNAARHKNVWPGRVSSPVEPKLPAAWAARRKPDPRAGGALAAL